MPYIAHLLLIALLGPQFAFAQKATLFDVYAQAVDADPRVRIAQHAVEVDRARASASTAVLLPQASFSATFSDNETTYESDTIPDQDYNGKRYSFQVRQVLFNWRAIAERSRSKQVVAQRESELLDAVSMLLVDASERYFQVLQAENELEFIRSEKETLLQQLKETEERFERKLVRITDLLEVRARTDAVRTDEIEAENAVAIARASLQEITGTDVGDIAAVREDFTLPVLENSMEYWTDLAMSNNSLLQARREAVIAAEKGVSVSKGSHMPEVSLIFSDQTSDTGFDNQQQPERDTTYIGVDISVPIFSGGAASAEVREAWALYYIAREEEEQARREVLRRSREAWLNTRSSRKRIDSSALGLESSQEAYDAMRKSFEYGTVTAADVLESLAILTRARRDHKLAVHEFILNWLVLKRESGHLETADLQQVNDWLVATRP